MGDVRAPGVIREVQLGGGTVRYRETGAGEPIVFVHGFLVHGGLWRRVVPLLAGRFRCIVPDLPLGSHEAPMDPGADLGAPALAKLVADFLDALDLEGVTLVGNDTGGALCQMVVASHPRRVARLVLTNCDTPGNFPPPLVRPFVWGARVPGFVSLVAMLLRVPVARWVLFGLVTKRLPERVVMDSYLAPFSAETRVRRDVRKVLLGISPEPMLAVEEGLAGFGGPVLLAWAPEDKVFPIKHAERLKTIFQNARIEKVPDSRAFVPEDRPKRLAELVGAFVGERAGTAQRGGRGAAP